MSSYGIPGVTASFIGAADLESKTNLFAKITAGDTINVCGAGEAAIGTILLGHGLGKATPVVVNGIATVIAGAAVAAGAEIQSDANGKAVTLAAGVKLGVALQAATAADQEIAIKVI